MRVLELSDREEAAAYCAKLFGRWGAEVLKVESADRSEPRRHLDVYLNGGKKRLALDARTNAGRRDLDALAREADILVTDYAPRDVEALRLLELGRGNASLVRVSITPFGLDGPYRDREATASTLLALGGYTHLMGDPGRAPLTLPGNYPYYQAGTFAYTAALAARLTGQGRNVEVSVLECLAALHQFTDTMLYFSGIVRSRHGNRWENLCPTTLLPCVDGWYGVNILQNFWFPFAQMIRRPDLASDGPLSQNAGRMEAQDEVEEIITRALYDWPKKRIFQEGQEVWRVPIGYAASLQDLLDDPHLNARGFWQEVKVDSKVLRVPGSPFRADGEGLPAEQPPLPRASGGSWTAARPAIVAPRSAKPARPLEGVRVLDLTRIWSGPLASRTLGDLGAEVIKVEATNARGPAGQARAATNQERAAAARAAGGNFPKLNRNKRSLSIDLKSDRGRRLFLDLVARSDVVMENFSARAMPGLGLDYDALRAANERIIYLAMPAFGLYGPYRDYVGLGPSIEPITGLTAIMGYSDVEPRVTSKALTDAIAGTSAAAAVLMALERRQRTGVGGLIDLSQHETGLGFIGEYYVEYQLAGREPTRRGNLHPEFAPHGVYRCAGEDEWIAIAVTGDEAWRALCNVLGAPELASDSRFASLETRHANAAYLDAEIEARTKDWGKRALEAALQARGVAAGAVLASPEWLADPHLEARAFWAEIAGDVSGVRWDGLPVRLDGERGHEDWLPSARLGQDNRVLLQTLLGLSQEEIDRLTEDGVLAEVLASVA